MTDDKAATAIDSMATAESHGSGNAINVYQVPEGVARPFVWLVAAILVFCLFLSAAALMVSLLAAPALLAKSEALAEKSSANTRYMVQVAYWMQRVEVMAEKQGLKLPPAPEQPKE